MIEFPLIVGTTCLLAVCTAWFVLFAVFAAVKYDTPVSLSSTYYSLGKYGWVFQCFMAAMACLLYPVWLSVTEAGHEWMVFLACASLLFVAAAPAFKMELEGKVHYTSAIICCVCAVLWQILEGLWDVTLWFVWIGGMLSLMWKDKWCWWLEVAVVGSLLANLWRII